MIYITYAYRPEIEALMGLAAGSPLCFRFIRAQGAGAGKALEAELAAGAGDDTQGRPEMIVNAGFAGALRPGLEPGEVVYVETIRETIRGQPPNSLINPELGGCPRITPVRCVTVADPVLEPAARDRLRQTTGADIVDMEARHLHDTARRYGVPFLSLKVISDRADSRAHAAAVGQASKWSKILGQAVYELLESSWK